MKRSFLLFSLMWLGCSSLSLADNTAWQLEAENEDKNIQVFTRKLEGSTLKEFKGVTKLKTDVNALVALLQDTQSATKWMHNIIEFEEKEKISEVESIVYSISETPWPVTDRDSYVRSILTVSESGVVKSTLTALPDYAPKDEDYVRMPSIKGGWVFTPLADGIVEVVYQIHADPGGSLPDWIVNSIVVETPLETLSNLHEQIQLKKYQQQTFSFIENLN